ncbi:forkhead box protein P4-like [Solea solea]|uniref:forkhead box protein P4-like n=1 Tax=Solea solea TaxID=90069 RepID=UPI00272C64A9|nr:forkhead box protein P4-like [Solea solea]
MPESPLSPSAARQTSASSLLTHTDAGTGERAANGTSCSGVSGENWQTLHNKQVFLAMMAPQQLQQLLSPNQLQALIQQKQQSLLLQQQHLKLLYKTQQQIQLLQQQPSKKVKEFSAQQLMFQQFLQLLQLQQQQQQQQLLQVQRPALSSPAVCPVGFNPAEIQQLWKELTNGESDDKAAAESNHEFPANSFMSTQVTARPTSDLQSSSSLRAERADYAALHVLYNHGVCHWPGCESVCENLYQFFKHIGSEHTLDDRSTAQCRVQMQVVQQLELQLCKERQRLRAMTSHLHLPSLEAQSPQTDADADADPHGPQVDCEAVKCESNRSVTLNSSQSVLFLCQSLLTRVVRLCCSQLSSVTSDLPSLSPSRLAQPLAPSQECEENSPTHTECASAIRHCQHPLVHSLPSGNYTVSIENKGLTSLLTTYIYYLHSENEYELYKNNDIRPPFTYATLIRQAITEAPDMQLTLNEIYNWFTRTFAYFRRNAATWKNAVRHNLSLHKCFVRVENVKGAVWTVDESEYQKRRSQKITGSPSLIKKVSSNIASLQTALTEASLPRLNQSVSRNAKSQSRESNSYRLQQSLFLKDEAMNLTGHESQWPPIKVAAVRQDVTEAYGEHMFDLE